MSGICEGRVVVITGAGRGIGRTHALEFARQGAKVVVNDLGGARDGTGTSASPAEEVVAEIEALGGEAVVNADDVSTMDGAGNLIQTAIDTFGKVDTLVNNAGILRDRMLVNMEEHEWDAVIQVHLKGTFGPARHAAGYWREKSKAGEPVDARIVNTSSASGLYGNVGQTNYGAAKAGIAAFTVIAAKELARYGIRVNCIAPTARTRMTEDLGMGQVEFEEGQFDLFAPENMSPLVVWLGSNECTDVTGRVFEVVGGKIICVQGWDRGPTEDKGARWESGELGPVVRKLVEQSREPEGMSPL